MCIRDRVWGGGIAPCAENVFNLLFKRRVLVDSDVRNVPVTRIRMHSILSLSSVGYKPTSYTYKYARVTHSCSNQRQDNNEVTGKQPVTVKGSTILNNDYHMSIHFKLLKRVPLITTMATHCTTFPSPPLDNIRVMVIVWRLRGNTIRTALCWIV